MYTKKQRATAWIACMGFLFVMLCSVLFLIKEADHVCTGEDCPICAQISDTENTLKNLGNGDPTVSSVVVTAAVYLLLALIGSICVVPYTTPVTQKVRLNN